MQILQGCPQILNCSPDRDPPITVVHHPVQAAASVNPKQNWWVWFLQRFGMTPDGIEIDELSVILRILFSPDRLHGFDLFPQHPPPAIEGRPMVLHLLNVPPATNAEEKAAVR